MSKPVGVARATKDNSRKHPYIAQQWAEGKKIGRPKQRFVPSTLAGEIDFQPEDISEENLSSYVRAHWEKIRG